MSLVKLHFGFCKLVCNDEVKILHFFLLKHSGVEMFCTTFVR